MLDQLNVQYNWHESFKNGLDKKNRAELYGCGFVLGSDGHSSPGVHHRVHVRSGGENVV